MQTKIVKCADCGRYTISNREKCPECGSRNLINPHPPKFSPEDKYLKYKYIHILRRKGIQKVLI